MEMTRSIRRWTFVLPDYLEKLADQLERLQLDRLQLERDQLDRDQLERE